MNSEQDKQEIIERYLLGEMDENEIAAFKKQLAADRLLREETELMRYIISAFRLEGEKAALEAMQSVPEDTFRKWMAPLRPVRKQKHRRLYMRIAVAAAAAIILFVLYIGTRPQYTPEQLFAQYYQTLPYEIYPVRGGFDLTPDEREWMRLAETSYRQQDYAHALALYNRLFAQKPDQKTLPEEVVFYSAICRLETDDLTGAIELLAYIASDGTSAFRDDAIWNLAFAYLKSGRRSKAVECLEQLIKKESDYTEKAKELREKLKEKKWF